MTNFERIKAMSVEEMAEFIHTISNCEMNDCSFCPITDGCGNSKLLGKWLETEVAE